MARLIYLEPDVHRADAGESTRTSTTGRRLVAHAPARPARRARRDRLVLDQLALIKWADTPDRSSPSGGWSAPPCCGGSCSSPGAPAPALRSRPPRRGSACSSRRPFFGANIALLFTAITKTSIAHAEFISSLSPLLLLPAGALFFKERPDWTALRWGLLSIVGIVLVLFFGPANGTATVGGDLLMIVVLVVWVGYLLPSKRARAAASTRSTSWRA